MVDVAMDPFTSPNPYISLFQRGLALHGVTTSPLSWRTAFRADALHLHWQIDTFTGRNASLRRTLRLLAFMTAFRLRRRPVVWTVHNLTSHELSSRPWVRVTRRLHHRLVTAWCSLSSAGVDLVEEAIPVLAGKPRSVTPHGPYEPVELDATATEPDEHGAVRAIHFGQLRRYKGTADLMQLFSGEHLRLQVLGAAADATTEQHLLALATELPNVELRLGRASDEALAEALWAADIAVLPYGGSSLNSGASLLALSYGRPVLLPRTAVYEELQYRFGDDLVQLFTPPLTADAIRSAAERVRPFRRASVPPFDMTDWSVAGARSRELYAR
jgi:beta-1,4-mannosyltransferase